MLRTVNLKPKQKYKSHLEGAKLVIDGKYYYVNNLAKLPQMVSPYKATTKTNRSTVGFFGELYPFSCFHLVKFTPNGKTFHSSEKLIQYTKVTY